MLKNENSGINRTGSTINPKLISDQVAFSNFVPGYPQDQNVENIKAVRMDYVATSDPIGTLPPLADPNGQLGQAASTVAQQTDIFADKLGQRLAFERTGARLYEALMEKALTIEFAEKAELTADLGHLHDEEIEHYFLLKNIMEQLGADPTAMTPAANVSGVAGQGFLQVITDPRTTLNQSLEAILSLELIDSTCWEHLIEAAKKAGINDFTSDFQKASETESEHVAKIEKWVKSTTHI